MTDASLSSFQKQGEAVFPTMAVTIDPLIRFRPGKEMSKFVDELEESEGDFPPKMNKGSLTVEDLEYIREKRREIRPDDGVPSFHLLLERCRMVLPEPEFPPRNPELEARIQRLKAEQANREYRRMTENVDGSQGLGKQDADEPLAKQMKELNHYLFLVLQLVVTVACGSAFGYMAPYLLRGVSATGTRMLSGVLFGFVAAVADLYFVVKFLLEAEGLISPGNIKVYDSQFAKKDN